jgi:excisionase family DNA binding protein
MFQTSGVGHVSPKRRILLARSVSGRHKERKTMPSFANRYSDVAVDENIPSHRKPPISESSAWRPKSTESTPLLNVPSHPTSDTRTLAPTMIDSANQERLLNAREVAARLGVSERWVRDHTTRRSPRIRGVKLGTLMRYRRADVDEFMEKLTTSRTSFQPQFGG